jgi:hypothetical protein
MNPAYHNLKLTPESRRQFMQEIMWLERRCLEVQEKMKRKPSKIRELNDLKRQIKERQDLLNR